MWELLQISWLLNLYSRAYGDLPLNCGQHSERPPLVRMKHLGYSRVVPKGRSTDLTILGSRRRAWYAV
jgi:hypothetical protein